jgi:hypothetical protein
MMLTHPKISEVKNYFRDHKTQYEDHIKKINASKEETHGRGGAGFLFITEPQANKAEILRSFPPKGTTDLLISRFFSTYTYDPAFRM